jgi:glycosyltransferase involved in cell wall biosynthesis
MSLTAPRFRLAVVASHPVQYYAPWYRALADVVDLQVFFAHRITAADHARSGFGVEFDWDVPLLDGYPNAWLENIAARPGPDHFWGCNTPDVAAALASGRFDAVVVTGWNLMTYWQAVRAARRRGLPVLVRGDSQLTTPRSAVTLAAKRMSYPWLLRSFDACLAVGNRSAEYYQAYGVPPARIYRSPHCVDNAFFAGRAAVARPERSGLRAAFGIPADAVVFAFAGKMIEKKRPFDFLQAISLAGRTREDVYGLMIGDGPLLPALREQSRAGAVRCAFTGFMNQREIAGLYALADVLVLASDARETWGLVVNEAMACGLPAIVSEQAGCAPDLVTEGETGLTYRGGDIDGLAACAIRMARDTAERSEMGRKATMRIAGFSPGAAAAGVVSALEGVTRVGRSKEHGHHVVDVVSG